MAAVC